MVEWGKVLLHEHEDLSSSSQYTYTEMGAGHAIAQ